MSTRQDVVQRNTKQTLNYSRLPIPYLPKKRPIIRSTIGKGVTTLIVAGGKCGCFESISPTQGATQRSADALCAAQSNTLFSSKGFAQSYRPVSATSRVPETCDPLETLSFAKIRMSPYPQLKGPQKTVDVVSPYPQLKGPQKTVDVGSPYTQLKGPQKTVNIMSPYPQLRGPKKTVGCIVWEGGLPELNKKGVLGRPKFFSCFSRMNSP